MALDHIQCPKCGGPCEADFVDTGVGEQQCGPYRCMECGWIETIPDYDFDVVTEEDPSS